MAYTKDEYYALKDQLAGAVSVSEMISKLLGESQMTVGKLNEEIEILRAERSHWYHMYNQECFNEEL
ncbi:hypothetical protein D3C72_765590 [compost metagenome]